MKLNQYTDDAVETEAKQPVVEENMEWDESKLQAPELETELPRSQKMKGGLAILGLLILVVGGGFGWQWWQSRNAADAAASPPAANKPMGMPVKLAPVERIKLEETSEFVGTLEAENSVELQPEMEGRVSEIYVRAGDRVEQGDVIASIDSRDAEVQLRQAKAGQEKAEASLAELIAGPREEEIAQARARLDRAEATLDELRTGNRKEDIAQAQARLEGAKSRLEALRGGGSSGDEIGQAIAQVEAAEARVALTEQRVKRNQDLASEGAISQDSLDEVVAEDRTARAALEQARKRLEEVKKNQGEAIEQAEAEVKEAQQALALQENGTRPEEIAKAEADVEENRQELRKLENGTRPEALAQSKAQVAEAAAKVRAYEVQVQNTKVVAPFSGIIGDVPVKVGDYVKKGDILTALTQNQALELRLSIPMERASELRLGLPVEITDPQGQPLGRGQLSFISPQADAKSQTVLAKATFDNGQGELRDRQFVRAKMIWNQRLNAVVVPTTAVIFQGEERFIYIAQGKEPMVAKRQAIELGLVQGDRAEVLKGLAPGDQIIISGMQKLADGVPIMPLPNEQQGSKGAATPPATGKQGSSEVGAGSTTPQPGANGAGDKGKGKSDK